MSHSPSLRLAVAISQDARLVHGGWGYAEDKAIGCYTVDALVLPIFVELNVVARNLLAE
ncbi:MAG TPA: hypothetical protein VKM54_20435 [Myxococcota bacterium]|nr:hypothetical protein [Myxococcota bacterium]